METTNRACRWVGRRLPLLAGGELGIEERRRVERHLIGCPACRERRDAAGRSLDVLRAAGATAAAASQTRRGEAGGPPSVWPALARQIRESRHQPPPAPRWSWRPAGLRLAAAAGLVGVGLALGMSWVAWSGGGPAPALAQTPATPPPAAAPAAGMGLAEPGPIYALRDADLPGAYDLLDGATIVPGRRPSPRPPADPEPRGTDRFQAPASLRVDYDLEWVTPPGPATPVMRQAY